MDLRCFIAIELPGEVKKNIDIAVSILRAKNADVKWIPSENMHLTLKFLGEVKDDMIPDIEKGLSLVCMNHVPFSINIRGAGAFPNFKYPNVLWVGIDESSELKGLYDDIEESMSELGFEKEDRKFSPHLTIGRVKDRKGIEPIMEGLYTFKDAFLGSIEVKEVLLMRSVLKPTGAEYSKIAGFKLSSK